MTDVTSLRKSLTRSVTGLVLFALVTAGAVSFTRLMTSERIEENRYQAAARLLYSLAPRTQYQLDIRQPVQLPAAPELGHQQPFAAHLAWQDDQLSMILLPITAPDGYTGRIELLVALHLNGQIQGVRVLDHRETPGLGDKIEERKSDWIHRFDGLSLSNPELSGWAVKKDGGEFDQFTGATITPRAVVNSVKRSLLWLQTPEIQQLLSQMEQPNEQQ
ncbi:MAG: electron transport complex subunit RsxG [Marinospirillum sp.]|uniref:electron transport complex subunit RsxG n=1 Tax=Marinospirillum sp. TaxID=2183934 RepID=UPI001A1094A0|nr:electron transport complex subunit RsxG [Marinospirillum sp.]MBE0505593.1 electron transport complex subunit RsxG [Marinospirillum sp.]